MTFFSNCLEKADTEINDSSVSRALSSLSFKNVLTIKINELIKVLTFITY